VEGHHVLELEGVEDACGDHRVGAAEARAGGALLVGLEHEHDLASGGAVAGEVAGDAEADGGVDVVAAGVHTARVTGLVRGLGLLLDGQGVDVGAEADHGAGLPRVEDGDDPGLRDALVDGLKARRAQPRGDDL
jgi:hypothetical protein